MHIQCLEEVPTTRHETMQIGYLKEEIFVSDHAHVPWSIIHCASVYKNHTRLVNLRQQAHHTGF